MPVPHDHSLLYAGLGIGALLLAIGAIGVAARRRVDVLWLSLAVMTQGALVAIAAFDRFHADGETDAFAPLAAGAFAVQCAIGAALMKLVARSNATLDVSRWTRLGTSVGTRRDDDEPLADPSPHDRGPRTVVEIVAATVTVVESADPIARDAERLAPPSTGSDGESR